ncbi:MAG TPA: FMN-binding negative transcriptional regulator [Steroidobacteraceae bacterium]|nr:FMN-binding negative transcriptional regulator [Steroidobacteraceae bacterium]
MYVPALFAENRPEVLHALMRAHPFATLVVMSAQGLEANHIPLEFEAQGAGLGVLRGHVSRANPVWKSYQPEVEALAIFSGPHTYISPSSYPTRAGSGMVVPTWNYAVVHARGPLKLVEDPVKLRAHVERLTAAQEHGRSNPWQPGEAPADFLNAQLGRIVGVEIALTSLIGKWKVSQNRTPGERAGVIRALHEEGSREASDMAALVERASPPKP